MLGWLPIDSWDMNRGVTAISFDLTKSHKKERGGGL
jgi:hypothetical protein